MTDALTDPLPPQRPLERHAQLETDCFCEHCGYNLHGQSVTRDPRLGILVCRCPECGRFHPAAHRTTATSAWLGRLAAMALLLWVLIILVTAFLIVLGFGGLQWAQVDVFSYNGMVDAHGREVVYQQVLNATSGARLLPVYAGTTQPVTTAVHYVRLLTPPQQRAHFYEAGYSEFTILSSLSAALGLLTGILLVVFFWHWKKRRYFLALLLPFAATAWDLLVMWRFADDAYEYIRLWATERLLYQAAVQAAFILIGILIGRPLARLLLRMFIPPKPRQHLAFLWRTDGKTPPPATPV